MFTCSHKPCIASVSLSSAEGAHSLYDCQENPPLTGIIVAFEPL